LISLTSVPGKVIEKLNLETVPKYMKSCSVNLIAFHSKASILMDGGKAYCLL